MGVHAGVKLAQTTYRPLSMRWGCPVVLLGSRSRVREAGGCDRDYDAWPVVGFEWSRPSNEYDVRGLG
jgi:hypothetical protein